MRVGFMGTPAFAVPTLHRLLQSHHDVVAVVAQPDRPAGRGQHLVSPPTVELARKHGVPVYQPRAVKQGPFPEAWASLDLDVAVVVAYGRILPPRLLDAPRRGCVNVHGSLLPRYRGAAPIQWAIARCERETGITTMRMDEGLDTGPMLLRRATPIGPRETAMDLAARLADLGADLLLETLDRLPDLAPEPQDDAGATWAPPLRKEDGRLDWARSARELDCQVRGMCPWPGAHAVFRDEPVRVVEVLPLEWEACDVPPGTVVETRRRLVVATGQGAVELRQVQCAGRRCQEGYAWVCGARVQVGEVFQ